MKRVMIFSALLTGSLLCANVVRAEDAKTETPAPSREELRKELEGLSPEEREAKIKEWHKKYGDQATQGFGGGDMRRRYAEMQNLSPEEREARMKQFRNSPEAQKMREEIMALPPEQREAKIKELREKYGMKGGGGEGMAKMREEMKDMTPEQREAKMKEMRERGGKGGGERMGKLREEMKNMTPEQREAKMKELRSQMEAKKTELEKKKADGTITPQEEQMLERINQFASRAGKGGPRRPGKE